MNNLKLDFNELLELHALVKQELNSVKEFVEKPSDLDLTFFNNELKYLESINSKIETLLYK